MENITVIFSMKQMEVKKSTVQTLAVSKLAVSLLALLRAIYCSRCSSHLVWLDQMAWVLCNHLANDVRISIVSLSKW